MINPQDLILSIQILPTYIKKIDKDDELTVKFIIHYRGEHPKSIKLDMIKYAVPDGFKFENSNIGSIMGQNLLLHGLELFSSSFERISMKIKAEKPMGEVRLESVLKIVGYTEDFAFPTKVLKTMPALKIEELFPFLKYDDMKIILQKTEKLIDTSFMKDLKQKIILTNQHILLYGKPGSGKSTTMALIAREMNGVYVDLESKEKIFFKTKEYEIMVNPINATLIYILKKLSEQNKSINIEKILKPILNIEDPNVIQQYLIGSLGEIASESKKNPIFLLLDSFDRLSEQSKDLFEKMITQISEIPNIKIITSSRRADEPLPFYRAECPGFTPEEAKEYLKEYNPSDEVIAAIRKPILPIYLFYVKTYLQFKNLITISKEIVEKHKTVEAWHHSLFSNLNNKQKLFLKLSAMFKDFEKTDLRAVSYAMDININEMTRILNSLTPLIIKENIKPFHPYFEEFILSQMTEAEITEYADKMAEFMKNEKRLTDELKFLMMSTSRKSKTRFLEIYYQIFEESYIRGNWEFCLDMLHNALEVHEEFSNKLGVASNLTNIGNMLAILGKYEEALEHHRKALEIHEELGNKLGVASDLTGIGNVLYRLGKYEEALEHYMKALEIHEELGNKLGVASDLTGIGNVLYRLGKYEEALEHHRKALKLDEELGNKLGVANDLTNIGNVLAILGKYEEALEHHRKALEIHEELGNKLGVANDLTNIGSVLEDLSKYKEALEHYRRALKLDEELGSKLGVANDLTGIGNVLYRLDKYEEALEHYKKALGIHEEIGSKLGVANDLTGIGNVLAILGRYEEALEHYRKALKLDEELGSKLGVANDLTGIGNVLAILGRYEEALEHYRKALKLDEELGIKLDVANDLTNIGNVLYRLGKYEEALEHHRKALGVHEELGSKLGVANDLTGIGNVLYRLGKYEEALEHHRKALKLFKEIDSKSGISVTFGSISIIFYELSDYNQTFEYYKNALEVFAQLNIKDTGSRFGVFKALDYLGVEDINKVVKLLEIVIERIIVDDPIGRLARELLRELKNEIDY